jgi:hypothetical protein
MNMISQNQIFQITNYINQYRNINQVSNLVWNNTISIFSQNYSEYLLFNNLFKHSNSKLYGENLAYFKGYGTNIMELLKLSIDSWYDEINFYDFNNPGFSPETGHFTCLVWKSTTSFGLGIAIDYNTSTVIVSMNTYLPGNIVGQTPQQTAQIFKVNVLPQILPKPIVPPPIPLNQTDTIQNTPNSTTPTTQTIQKTPNNTTPTTQTIQKTPNNTTPTTLSCTTSNIP